MEKELQFIFEAGVSEIMLEEYIKIVTNYMSKVFSWSGDEEKFKKELKKRYHYSVPSLDRDGIIHILYLILKADNKLTKINKMKNENYESDILLNLSNDAFHQYDCMCVNIELFNKSNNGVTKWAKEKAEAYECSFNIGDSEYHAVVPKNSKEIIAEGVNMHNCLVMRPPYVADGRMDIIFLRKNVDEPLIDICINNENQKIMWAITDGHITVEDENLEAVYHWYKEHIKKVSIKNMWTKRWM